MVFTIKVKILLHKHDPSSSSPKDKCHTHFFLYFCPCVCPFAFYAGLVLYEAEQKRDRSAWALMGGQSKSMLPKVPALTTMPLSSCKWKKQRRRKAWLDLGWVFAFQCCLQLESFTTTVIPSVHPAE